MEDKNRLSSWLTLMIGVLILAACAPASATQIQPAMDQTSTSTPSMPIIPTLTSQAPSSGPQQVMVSEQDMGNDFQLNLGDTLVITLASNPSTGYSWEVDPVDNAILELAGDPTFKPDSELIGAPGMSTLVLKATRSGDQTLMLIYHRSFEKDTPPIKVFTVIVTVAGAPASSQTAATPTLSSQVTPTTIVNPPNGWKGWQVYINLEYGFSFQYPPEWRLVEVQGEDKTLSGHAVQLFPNNNSDALMQVAYKHADDDMHLGQTGLAQGELIAWGKVVFLGKELTRQVLVDAGKHLTVLYTSPNALSTGDVTFNFSLNSLWNGSDSVGLTEAVEFGSDAIVASVVLLP